MCRRPTRSVAPHTDDHHARKKIRLNQSTLANKVGVSRLWIVEIEKGKPRAQIALVLRTLATLDINLNATSPGSVSPEHSPASVDIDAIVSTARKPGK
jgi:HTH-type transcriptional regulator / antitoxin HipB